MQTHRHTDNSHEPFALTLDTRSLVFILKILKQNWRNLLFVGEISLLVIVGLNNIDPADSITTCNLYETVVTSIEFSHLIYNT